MKANEYVKQNGWTMARKAVAECTYGYGINLDDLKRLVESHELVQLGLPELKKAMFSDSKDLEYVKNWFLTVSEKLLTEKGIKLKQAILDVESCNE